MKAKNIVHVKNALAVHDSITTLVRAESVQSSTVQENFPKYRNLCTAIAQLAFNLPNKMKKYWQKSSGHSTTITDSPTTSSRFHGYAFEGDCRH